MEVYGLTGLGKRTAKGDGDSEELRILRYIRESRNRTATSDELDTVGERWVVRRLVEKGLLEKLTT